MGRRWSPRSSSAAATIDPATGLRALLRAPDGFFPVPALQLHLPAPLLLPFPPLPRGAWGPAVGCDPARNPSGAARGQSPFPFFSLTRVALAEPGQTRRSPPGEVSEGRLGVRSGPAPSGLYSSGGPSVRFPARYDGEVSEPLVGRQGSRVSMRMARGSASLLSSHSRGIWPRDVLKKVSRGLSRVEAGNPGFPRLVQVTSGDVSWWL